MSELKKKLSQAVARVVPENLRETIALRGFGFFKIPMLYSISPSVQVLTDERCVVKVPLNRRTKNHLNSMYFAALAAGADCAGGLIAMRLIQRGGNQVNLIFKDFHAEFLKRAEGDVLFSSDEGTAIQELVKKAMDSGERVQMPVHITARVPSQFGDEPVARFILTLSLKRKR